MFCSAPKQRFLEDKFLKPYKYLEIYSRNDFLLELLSTRVLIKGENSNQIAISNKLIKFVTVRVCSKVFFKDIEYELNWN